jgi:hypothetical protein
VAFPLTTALGAAPDAAGRLWPRASAPPPTTIAASPGSISEVKRTTGMRAGGWIGSSWCFTQPGQLKPACVWRSSDSAVELIALVVAGRRRTGGRVGSDRRLPEAGVTMQLLLRVHGRRWRDPLMRGTHSRPFGGWLPKRLERVQHIASVSGPAGVGVFFCQLG